MIEKLKIEQSRQKHTNTASWSEKRNDKHIMAGGPIEHCIFAVHPV